MMTRPIVNSLNRPYWDAAARGELVLPFCVATGRAFWPPSPISPFATGGAVEWRKAAPLGQVITRVVYRRGFLKQFEPLMPYAIGLVELDAGPRLLAHIARADAADAPLAGARVRLQFEKLLGDDPILTARRLNI
jgi:uncharacterized OB-fold protein